MTTWDWNTLCVYDSRAHQRGRGKNSAAYRSEPYIVLLHSNFVCLIITNYWLRAHIIEASFVGFFLHFCAFSWLVRSGRCVLRSTLLLIFFLYRYFFFSSFRFVRFAFIFFSPSNQFAFPFYIFYGCFVLFNFLFICCRCRCRCLFRLYFSMPTLFNWQHVQIHRKQPLKCIECIQYICHYYLLPYRHLIRPVCVRIVYDCEHVTRLSRLKQPNPNRRPNRNGTMQRNRDWKLEVDYMNTRNGPKPYG